MAMNQRTTFQIVFPPSTKPTPMPKLKSNFSKMSPTALLEFEKACASTTLQAFEATTDKDWAVGLTTADGSGGGGGTGVCEEASIIFREPVSRLLPMKCQQCKEPVFIKDHFACRSCECWALCGACILDYHLDHQDTIHLYRYYLHRFDKIRSWIWHVANANIDFIRSMRAQLQKAYDEYNEVIGVTPCRSDPIFYEVVNEYAMDVNGYRTKYTKTTQLYADLEKSVNDLLTYLENREWPFPPKFRLQYIATIYDRVHNDDNVQAAFRWIEYMVEDEQIKGARNAMQRLRGTNRLLRTSYSPRKCVANATVVEEKPKLKGRLRTRSVNGDK